MTRETLLTVEHWKNKPLSIVRGLLGNREMTSEYELISRLMESTVCKTRKKWRRSTKKYDAVDIANEIENRRSPLRILDVGCGDAHFLSEIRKIYRNRVECYGISVMEHPHDSDINYFICPAEIMPEEWDGVFDIVTTHQAFKYMLFPHLALKESIRVLRDGGVFSGYIGTSDEERRIFYNRRLPYPLSDEVSKAWSRNKKHYDDMIEQIILEIPYTFTVHVVYTKENKPHKIHLVKSGLSTILNSSVQE